jgi:Homeodomain-like domain
MGNSNSGRGGLPRAVRREMERLIAAGWKSLHIARKLGINRSTVSRAKRRLREAAAGPRDADPDSQTVRCGGCGASVLVSVGYCIACYQRKTALRDVPRRSTRRRATQKASVAA